MSAKGANAVAAGGDVKLNALGPHSRVSVEAFPVPRLNVSVVANIELLEGEPVTGPEIDARVDAERARLARPEPKPAAPPGEPDLMAPYRDLLETQAKAVSAVLQSLAQAGITGPEDQRTEAQFDAELERHLASCREVLTQRTDFLLLRNPGNWLRLSVVNNTETVFRDVEVIVTVHNARSLEPIGSWPKLPDMRPWRAPRVSGGWWDAISLDRGLVPYAVLPAVPRRRARVSIDGGEIRVVFPGLDLRPGGGADLPVVHLVPLGPEGGPCLIEWEATAMNADGREKGTLSVSMASSTVSLAQLGEDRAPHAESP
ncbi:hypothetical protein [Streptacidiphilus anmyonensis]|uniref:hypothetical protein n=1 Tax=Streptacidiphilus anmyonensis TaxID=405782 RepID=UPI00128C68E2|nr:hypothetical protein [Streptacidiphilus anmyonensis]